MGTTGRDGAGTGRRDGTGWGRDGETGRDGDDGTGTIRQTGQVRSSTFKDRPGPAPSPQLRRPDPVTTATAAETAN